MIDAWNTLARLARLAKSQVDGNYLVLSAYQEPSGMQWLGLHVNWASCFCFLVRNPWVIVGNRRMIMVLIRGSKCPFYILQQLRHRE